MLTSEGSFGHANGDAPPPLGSCEIINIHRQDAEKSEVAYTIERTCPLVEPNGI